MTDAWNKQQADYEQFKNDVHIAIQNFITEMEGKFNDFTTSINAQIEAFEAEVRQQSQTITKRLTIA